MTESNKVREYVKLKYVQPAISRGERQIKVRAGDIHRELDMKSRVPLVCQALRSQMFLKENHLVLEKVEGPPSGQSSSVVFTFRAEEEPAREAPKHKFANLLRLEGIGKELFDSLGGGEQFLLNERREFNEAIEKMDRERGLIK